MKVGSFNQEEEPTEMEVTGRTGSSRGAGADSNDRDRKYFPGAGGRVQVKALELAFGNSKAQEDIVLDSQYGFSRCVGHKAFDRLLQA